MKTNCAVCGKEIVAEEAPFKFESENKTYHLCCEHCYAEFKQNPDKYII